MGLTRLRVDLAHGRTVDEGEPSRGAIAATQGGVVLALGIDPTAIELDPHQFAMLAGIRAGYNAMLQRFNPELLDSQYARSAGPTQRSRYWELYRESFRKLSVHSEGGFRRLFGEAFEQAYHRALDELLLTEHKG